MAKTTKRRIFTACLALGVEGGSSFSQAATLAQEEAFSVILALQLLNLSHRPNAFHPQQGSAFNQSSMALITILIPRHHRLFTYSEIESGSQTVTRLKVSRLHHDHIPLHICLPNVEHVP